MNIGDVVEKFILLFNDGSKWFTNEIENDMLDDIEIGVFRVIDWNTGSDITDKIRKFFKDV